MERKGGENVGRGSGWMVTGGALDWRRRGRPQRGHRRQIVEGLGLLLWDGGVDGREDGWEEDSVERLPAAGGLEEAIKQRLI